MVIRDDTPVDTNALYDAACGRFAKPLEDPIFLDLRAYVDRETPAYGKMGGDKS